MSMIKACLVKDVVKNTGVECGPVLSATAMLFAVPDNFTFTIADLLDPIAFFKSKISAPRDSRIFPFFGQKCPIREIVSKQPNDTIVTLEDGLQVFLRYGFYERTFSTNNGGICFAEALQSFNRSGYSIIELDKEGKMLVRDNKDGTMSGLKTDFIYSPSPTMADMKSTPYKNHLTISYSPVEFVNNGIILSGGSQLLGLQGLIEASPYQCPGMPNSSTTINVAIKTDCAETDLVKKLGGSFIASNFHVDGANTITSITLYTPTGNSVGYIALVGSFHGSVTVTINDVSTLPISLQGYDFGSVGFVAIIP